MNLARIPYINTAPYFHFFSERWLSRHRISSANPRELGLEARAGRLDAGLFSLVDAQELIQGGGFEPLGDLCIAGRGPVRSVLLFGAKDPRRLEGKAIAVTDHTATSSKLLRVWLREKVGLRAWEEVSLDQRASAALLIGDPALSRLKSPLPGEGAPIDLCAEWSAWTGLPFVFARWAVRAALPEAEKRELYVSLKSALELALDDLEAVAEKVAQDTAFEREFVESYLAGIRYTLGPEEEKGMALFNEKLAKYNIAS